MPSEIKIVYRASTLEEADIIVAWLDEQGITAVVRNRATAGMLEIPVMYAAHGMEVCVADAEQAERAVAALKEHYREQSDAAGSGSAIETKCEGCGETASFPYAQHGLVQNCPHCDAYIDVPEAPAR